MDLYLSCELVSLVMLAITLFFYNYKNWIDLKKNRVYLELLRWGITGVAADVIGGGLLLLLPSYTEIIQIISAMFMGVLLMGFCMQLCLYDMAFVGFHGKGRKVELVFLNVFVVIGLLSVMASPVIGYDTLQHYHIAEMYGRTNRIQAAIMLLCLVFGLVHLVILGPKRLNKREFLLLVVTNILLCLNIVLEVYLKSGYLASYYLISVVLVTYYLLLHNMDRYRFKPSGCFAKDGLYAVLVERETCRENFYCLGVAIKNIKSITNYCTEDEIVEFHQRMGGLLQKYCGKHNVYHTHSFEYMLLCSSDLLVEKKHKLLLEKMPDYIRINGKNVALSVDYYAVEFADADYMMENFYSVITSMRKLAAKQENKEKLLHYHGNRQRDIEKNLEAMRVVNQSITNQGFMVTLAPIQSTKNPDKYNLEAILTERLEDGEVISQEEVWRLAERMGLSKEYGKAEMEQVCQCIANRELVTSGVKKVNINMSSMQLEDVELAKEYIAILKKYHIPGQFICFEVNLNMSSDYKALGEVFGVLRGNGISLLLDQFGVSVCSLKSVINMPFDAVKINHRITKGYCTGVSNQLPYLLDMLNTRKWSVVVDGIDEVVWMQKLEGLQYSYAQGKQIQRLYEEKQPAIPEAEMGGALVG